MPADAPYKPVSPRFWLARQSQLAVLGALLLAGALILSATAPGPAGPATAAGAIALVALAWSVERGRYLAWGYAEREDDLVVRRGMLFRRISVVPYGRMQFIDVTAGPIDRLFGLATVQLHTAAAATDARIPGLKLEDAVELRDRLATVGEAQATGL